MLLMHASTCASQRNCSAWGLVCTKARNRLAIERTEKIVYICGNAGTSAAEVELILQRCEENEQEQQKEEEAARLKQQQQQQQEPQLRGTQGGASKCSC